MPNSQISIVGLKKFKRPVMTEVEIFWLPVVAVCFAQLLSAGLVILYWAQGHYEAGRFPTVSYSAMWFPGNRIIAVGLGLICVFIITVARGVTDSFQLRGHRLARPIFILSIFCGAMFLVTGSVNFGEVPDVHNPVASLSFFSLIILDLLVVIAEVQLGIGKCVGVQIFCVVMSFASMAAGMTVGQLKRTDLTWSLIGVFEFGVIAFATFALLFAYHLLKTVRITLVLENEQTTSLSHPLKEDFV
jgi:hypothetical protein